jgi:hypothetical protein
LRKERKMKGAFDSFLKGGEKPAPAMGPSDEDMDSMFGESEEGSEDPLMEALEAAGFPVDEGKLSRIRGILEEKGEGEPTALGGEETPEEEALEAKKPPMAKGKPNL